MESAQGPVAGANAGADPGAVVVVGLHAAVADGAVVRAQPLPRATPLAQPPRRRPLAPGQRPAAAGLSFLEHALGIGKSHRWSCAPWTYVTK